MFEKSFKITQRNKELKQSLKKVILEKETLKLEVAHKETKLASLQRETRCKAMQEEKLKEPDMLLIYHKGSPYQCSR